MHGTKTPKREPFCRFPNAVMRDKRLGPAARMIAAYQGTFVGDYTLDATTLRKNPIARTGLGRDVIERANGELCAAGYKKRWQPPSTGDRGFGRCVEKLTLPACGATGEAGRIVYRKWFDGQLSVNEMAAYLYFRAGTGRGPIVFASELAKTFGWSRPTAAAVITALIELGLVARREKRDANGRIEQIGYQALPPILWQKPLSKFQGTRDEPLSNLQGTRYQGTRYQGTRIQGTNVVFDNPPHEPFGNPLHEPPSVEPSARTQSGSYASPPSAAEAPPPSDATEDARSALYEAFESDRLLGWAADDDLDADAEIQRACLIGADQVDMYLADVDVRREEFGNIFDMMVAGAPKDEIDAAIARTRPSAETLLPTKPDKTKS